MANLTHQSATSDDTTAYTELEASALLTAIGSLTPIYYTDAGGAKRVGYSLTAVRSALGLNVTTPSDFGVYDEQALDLLMMRLEAIKSTADATQTTVAAINSVLRGAGAPSDASGADGDVYIDTDNGAIYTKNSGSWSRKDGVDVEASATAAAASATAAAGSATAASSSETNAATSETNAAASASAASGSASAASSSASAASGSATAAAASAAAAEATVNATGFQFTFDTGTTDADPGAGNFRFNNASPASATAIYIDNLDGQSADVSGWIDYFDDVANSGSRGTLSIRGVDDPVDLVVASVTGAVTNGTGYRRVPLTVLTASGALTGSEEYLIRFAPAGADGADGIGAGDMIAANNLSDLADTQTALNNLGLTDADKGDITAATGFTSLTINAGAVDTAELAADAVTNAKLANNAANTDQIANDAVTLAKIDDAALSGADATLVTGTAGTANTAAMWNADGDLIEATATAGDALPLTAPGGSGNLAASVDTLGELVTAVDTLATGGGGFQSVQIFTISGTWTRPAGITKVTIAVTGGGGGGGDTSSEIGGGAATVWKYALDVSAIASSTITIGAGGAGDSGSGSDGGASSWADGSNTISADGGRSGSSLGTLVTGTGGDIVMARRASEDGKSSYWGAGGEDGTAGQNAPATSYGAGGGAVTGSNSNSGGDGADGVVVVWEFA